MIKSLKLFYYRYVLAIALALAVAGCVSGGGPTLPVQPLTQPVQPLTQADMQQNVANALYVLKTVGCLGTIAAVASAPVIAIAGDAQGNQVLSAVSASGATLCTATIPATALPVPAPASAPAATLAVATK